MASPKCISLYYVRVQDVETVVGDISGAIQQLKNLLDVTLDLCSDELIKGVVGGVVVNQCIQKFSFGTYQSEGTILLHVLYIIMCMHIATACTVCVIILYTSSGEYSEEVLKSLENIKSSKNLRDFTSELKRLPSHYMASIVCGCFQSRTIKKLKIDVREVRVY